MNVIILPQLGLIYHSIERSRSIERCHPNETAQFEQTANIYHRGGKS
jgi:hypothetical protein